MSDAVESSGSSSESGARAWSARAREAKAIGELAVPLGAANVGMMLLGITDSAVVGRLGELELGAVGVANMLFFAVTVVGLGVMLALDPLVSQALGANEPGQARRWLWQGMWAAVLVSVPLCGVLLCVRAILTSIQFEPAAIPLVEVFLLARLPGIVVFLVFAALRSYLQAHRLTTPVVVAVAMANLVNLPLVGLLVLGDRALSYVGLPGIGFPALGVAGAGLANTFSTLVQIAVMAYAVRGMSVAPIPDLRKPDRHAIARTLRLGAPIGLQLLAEVGVFATVHAVMGRMGRTSLAAHQVAISVASLAFMIPFGIAQATSVRVGHAIGRGDVRAARRAGNVAIGIGALFMAASAFVLTIAPEPFARLITEDPHVVARAVTFLGIAAVFQIFDGTQVIGAGALRGAGDTAWPVAITIMGYYAIGLSTSLILAFGFEMGPEGLWWGLVAGLATVAVLLVARFERLTRRAIARV